MNSVFNLASYNLNQMTDDELLSWLHSEGLANMPPIIRTLAERLEAVQNDVSYAQEETKDAKEAFKKLDKDTIEGLNKLDDKLGHFASDLEKVSTQFSNLKERFLSKAICSLIAMNWMTNALTISSLFLVKNSTPFVTKSTRSATPFPT